VRGMGVPCRHTSCREASAATATSYHRLAVTPCTLSNYLIIQPCASALAAKRKTVCFDDETLLLSHSLDGFSSFLCHSIGFRCNFSIPFTRLTDLTPTLYTGLKREEFRANFSTPVTIGRRPCQNGAIFRNAETNCF